MRRFLVAMLLLATAAAQFQPVEPDWSGLEQRMELTPAGDLAGAQRVLRFVQVSDAHILDDDAPYPLRQEPLDALGGYFTSAQRPQDEYTDEVLDAMIRTINGIHAQDRLDFVMNTGDNIDNELENELMRFIDNWEGTVTTVGPVSGAVCRPDGQSADVEDDSQDVTDACTHLPDALAADNTALAAGLPWFAAFGNHDGLIQGNVPPEPSFDEIAAEFGRYFLRQSEYVSMHFAGGTSCDGGPAGGVADDLGHGYGFAGQRLCDDDPDNDGYYAFSARGVRFVVLDTVNDDFVTGNEPLAGFFHPQSTVGYDLIGGYSEGAIDPVQFDWLIEEVKAHSDHLVIVMSHHTVNSMFSSATEGQCHGPSGECLDDLLTQAGYKTGPELTAALAEHPNVVAWIGGHTHRHRVEAKFGSAGGFWNIETSSLIDMPQEARVIELWVTADGAKGFVATTRLGHDLEASRQLAAADPQGDAGAAGGAQDQDVVLWFDIPAGVELLPQPSLPRMLVARLVEPVAVNGSHARVGENVTARLHVVDNLLHQPVDGLQITVRVERADAVGATGTASVPTTPVAARGGGDYTFVFPVQSGGVHYIHYTLSDPSGAFPEARGVEPLTVEPEVEAHVANQKSPGPGLLALAAWAAVVVALRRR